MNQREILSIFATSYFYSFLFTDHVQDDPHCEESFDYQRGDVCHSILHSTNHSQFRIVSRNRNPAV